MGQISLSSRFFLILLLVSHRASNTQQISSQRVNQVYVNGYWIDKEESMFRGRTELAVGQAKTSSETESTGGYKEHFFYSYTSSQTLDETSKRETSFLPYILRRLKVSHDLVYLSRFWYEKKISYARTSSERKEYIQSLSNPSFLSAQKYSFESAPSLLSWIRQRREDNYFMRINHRGRHPETFQMLAESMHAILANASLAGVDVKVIIFVCQ